MSDSAAGMTERNKAEAANLFGRAVEIVDNLTEGVISDRYVERLVRVVFAEAYRTLACWNSDETAGDEAKFRAMLAGSPLKQDGEG